MKDNSSKTADSIMKSAITEGDTKGTYRATLKGSVPGKYTVVPEHEGKALGELRGMVTLTAITAASSEQGLSTITRDKDAYISGDDITVTVTLKDANGARPPPWRRTR